MEVRQSSFTYSTISSFPAFFRPAAAILILSLRGTKQSPRCEGIASLKNARNDTILRIAGPAEQQVWQLALDMIR